MASKFTALRGTTKGQFRIGDRLVGSLDIDVTSLTNNLTWSIPNNNGSSGYVLTTDGAGVLSWASPTVGLSAVVDDLTPQLGGNLDLQSNKLTIPDVNSGDKFSISDELSGIDLLTLGYDVPSNRLVLDLFFNSTIKLQQPPIEGIDVTNKDYVDLKCPWSPGNLGFTISDTPNVEIPNLQRTHAVWFGRDVNHQIPAIGGSPTNDLLFVGDSTNGVISFLADDFVSPMGINTLGLNGLIYPAADGTSGQVLETDGAGTIDWATPSAGEFQGALDYVGTGETITIPLHHQYLLVTAIELDGGTVDVDGTLAIL